MEKRNDSIFIREWIGGGGVLMEGTFWREALEKPPE